MEREAFLYVKAKLLNSSIANRKNFGSGGVHFNLTGTYMNDPFSDPFSLSFLGLEDLVDIAFAVREPFGGNIQGV